MILQVIIAVILALALCAAMVDAQFRRAIYSGRALGYGVPLRSGLGVRGLGYGLGVRGLGYGGYGPIYG